MKPNIFNFATKELSQDAFLCYLLEFSKEEYKKYEKEHIFANIFLKNILNKFSLDIEVKKLEIKKQYNNIDILLILNDEYYIIIEDKTFTSERKKQIISYKDKLKKILENDKRNFDEEKIYGLYFKIGDECLQRIEEKEKTKGMNIKSLLRKEIINIFENYSGENIIFNDYISYIKEIQERTENFSKVDLRKEMFTWGEVNGFYNALDLEFIKLKKEKVLSGEIKFNWYYVANQNGGFMCYNFDNAFNKLNFKKYGYYMQIEARGRNRDESRGEDYFEKDLRFPVKVWSDEKNIDILYKGFEILKKEKPFSDGIRPLRFSKGRWMTQLIIIDYLTLNENGTINISKTALNIAEYLKELLKLDNKLKNLED